MKMNKLIAVILSIAMLFAMSTVACALEEYTLAVGDESVSSTETSGTLANGKLSWSFEDGVFYITADEECVIKDYVGDAAISSDADIIINAKKKVTFTVDTYADYAVKTSGKLCIMSAADVELIALTDAISAGGTVCFGCTEDSNGHSCQTDAKESLVGMNYVNYNGKTLKKAAVNKLDMEINGRAVNTYGADENDGSFEKELSKTETIKYTLGDSGIEKLTLTLSGSELNSITVNCNDRGLAIDDAVIEVKKACSIIADNENTAIKVKNAPLTIKGSGSLKLEGMSCINVPDGKLSASVGTLSAKLLNADGTNTAISAKNIEITSNSFKVDASQAHDSTGISAEEDIFVDEDIEEMIIAGRNAAMLAGTEIVAGEEIYAGFIVGNGDEGKPATYLKYPVKGMFSYHELAIYDINVCGTDITEVNMEDVLGDGKVSYKETSSSLYLSTVSWTDGGITVNCGNGGKTVESITLRLSGESNISLSKIDDSVAVDVRDADLYIKGDGTIEMTSSGNTVNVEGNIKFQGGDIRMKSTEGIAVYATDGIKLSNTEISKGGSIKEYDGFYGIGTTKNPALEVRVKEEASSSGSSGGSSGSSAGATTTKVTKCTVTFISMGKVEKTQTVEAGNAVTAPVLELNGYKFEGWYTLAAGGNPVDLAQPVAKTMIVYARWSADTTTPKKRITLKIDSEAANVDGELVKMDAPAFIDSDRTYTPARFVAECLGANVEWDETTRKVTISKDGVVIEIIIDSDVAYVNGEEKKLDAPAVIKADRTYTPARFVAECLGAKVEWDESAREVTITQ